ncbi:MAG TPA: hypothetical protein VFU41_02095 [Gemmatimonadales bacterium]|nr:hypothetical protein [Gemmatimonadales bacterium]
MTAPPAPPQASHGKDPLAIGLGALACGIGVGGATITLAQVAVKVLQGRIDPVYYPEVVADPLLAGLFAGVVVATLFAWRRSRPLDNIWQGGVIGVLAAVGALLVGFLAAVADRFLGFAGLVVWGALSVAVGVVGSRRAIAGSRGGGEA